MNRAVNARRVDEIQDRGRGQPRIPEEGVDLAVLQRVNGLCDAEALRPDVALRIEAGCQQDTVRQDGRAGARRAGGHGAAAQVRDAADSRIVQRHQVHVAGIQHGERADGDRADALEPFLAGHRVLRGVGHRERDVGRALLQELQVVHRRRRHFRGRFDAGKVLADHLGDAAAVRIEHAPGAAGRDGQALFDRRGRRSAGARSDRERDKVASGVSHHGE